MSSLILIFLFIFGISIGSFLGVVIDRLPRNKSILFGRSHCDYCKHTLSWNDLIPLVSFFILNRRCRYCKKKLSWNFVLFEFLCGVFFVCFGLVYPPFLQPLVFTFNIIIFCFLFAIFFIDLFNGIIPDILVLLASLTTGVYVFVFLPQQIFSSTISALVSLLFFLFLFFITKGKGMGLGDVKYAFFMGLLLGWPKILFGMYTAFLTGAIVSLILVIWGKKRFFGGTIPFGPFLVFGTLFSIFFGNLLWEKILHFFL